MTTPSQMCVWLLACAAETEKTMDLDLNVPGLDSTVSRYSNGPPGIAVELWTIHGGIPSPYRPLGLDVEA